MDLDLILEELKKIGWFVSKDFYDKNKDFLQAIVSETEKQLMLGVVVGQSEQLPCDCGVQLKETTMQVFCPKCYKTWKMK